MAIHYFRSAKNPNSYGFAADPEGSQLPAEEGPWTPVGGFKAEPWRHPARREVVNIGLAENGFYLWDSPAEPVSTNPVIASDRVEGTEVFSAEGKAIGTIERLFIDKQSGMVRYADMTFGGFLGLGKQHHRIPWAKLDYDTQLGGYRTDITEAELSLAPDFRDLDYEALDHRRERELNDYWKTTFFWGP